MKEGMIQSDVTTVIQPRVLFNPGSWIAKIDFINHLILFNNVLITVLAEKEGGKTSFGTLLQSNLDQQIKSVYITAKPLCNRDIIKEIATQLQINYDENTDISAIAAQINEQKAHVLLTIDDAQYVPVSLIKEALVVLKSQENFSFFHLCLISDYSIVATLNALAAPFFENLIHTIELGALNESEARTYVLQRAMTAHLITRPLTDLQFKQFYQLTKGNISKINNSLEAYIFKCGSQKKKDSLKWVKKGGIAASLALFSGFIGFYFSQSYDFYSLFHLCRVSASNPSVNIPTTAQEIGQAEVLVSQIAFWQDSSTRQLVYSSLPTKQILDEIDEEVPNDTVAIVDKVVVIPKVQPKNPAQEKPQTPSADLVGESRLVSIKKFRKGTPATPAKVKIQSNPYTIQLAASHNKNEIERFRRNNKLLATHAIIRHFTNAKGVWYVLTVGEYETSIQAQQSIRKLPVTLTKLNPWVRQISSFG